ncbi:hypothetical protein B0B39_10895 [Legionella longbeachae]|uniref:hypothetical protein n=1 Tax=Legionella longbeachae TaxID=450 RepID=UPI000A1C0845|nr:hypothetical protein [Legionella longbeachae]ARM34001.1 hypothetical protein B0B39_10895 [Legionella longbeachae]
MTNNSNAENSWGVPFSQITFFQSFLEGHQNIDSVQREQDIIFTVYRISQRDTLKILCCREYIFGVTLFYRAMREFSGLNIIYIGGNWNQYTTEAKNECLKSKIGLYATNEMSGALWKDEFWNYYKNSEN